MTPLPLSVVVLTHNEESNLPACLQSAAVLGCPLFVVDSGSTDRTVEIARHYGAHVETHAFETHSKQWLWAFENLPVRSEWLLAIDADQYVPADLAAEIRTVLTPGSPQELAGDVNGVYLNRRYIFRGRWLRHGGLYPKPLLKLFRRQHVRIDEYDLLDHHFYRCDMVEHNRKEDDIAFWSHKHIHYAAKLATEEVARRRGVVRRLVKGKFLGTPDERIVALKNMWAALPPYIRPLLYFLYRYVLRWGWLDGKQGLIFHFLQALWFRFLVDVSVEQLLVAEPASASGNGSDLIPVLDKKK
jgi:glycosyltransferase involved in cell wall biosynthesis